MEGFLIAAVTLATAFVTGWMIIISLRRSDERKTLRQIQELNREQEVRLREYEKYVATLEERVRQRDAELDTTVTELRFARTKAEESGQLASTLKADLKNLQEKINTQESELVELQKRFTLEFENIASRLLKQSTETLSSTHLTKISEVLHPLKEKIQQFEKKVEDTYLQGVKDQTDLKAELRMLHDLNKKLGDEAGNLTRALKGDVKVQGNWGEFILEKILEKSGLTEGREFRREAVITDAEGKTIRPDVIIYLPDNKHLIIDSKVSLSAYERMTSADDESHRSKWLKEHLNSLKSHVRELSQKHYNAANGVNSPDFVLLFIPVEASFSVAVREDQELFSYAWDLKIVMVSPTTLLATLRTIASIWKQENQTRNALEIAKVGGTLYDKFAGFLEDMESIGNNLESTRKNFDKAMNKLSSGRGNLLTTADKLRELGVKATKEIPPASF